MTALPDPRALTVLSVRDPAAAARTLMALDVPRGALWSALILMAAIQALIYGISDFLLPTPEPYAQVYGPPLQFFGILIVGLVLLTHSIRFFGRIFGGTGRIEDVLLVMNWLMVLRSVVQVAALVLVMAVPGLAMVLLMAASLIGFYIMLHFINQAHHLGSLWRAFFVLITASFVAGIVLSFLLMLAGMHPAGYTGNV